jgi:hypothetical protein
MLIFARWLATLAANVKGTLSGLALLVFLPLIYIFKYKNTPRHPTPENRTKRPIPPELDRLHARTPCLTANPPVRETASCSR